MKDLSKFHPLLFPPLLFVLCFLLRFSLISKGPFELDCLSLALKSEQFITTGKLQYLSGAGYPLAVLLGAFFIKITNLLSIRDSVFAVNFMSVCFGSAIAPLQYLLTKNLIPVDSLNNVTP